MKIKDIFRKGLEIWWLDYLYYLYGEIRNYIPHRMVLKDIQNHGQVRIAFIIMHISQWKLQKLVELLNTDNRFKVQIILSPSLLFEKEQQEKDLEEMRMFFSKSNTPYVDFDFNNPYNLKDNFNPHILFYTQPYGHIHSPAHDVTSFKDRLKAYAPYSFWSTTAKFGFDLSFHRHAWRIYYANKLLFEYAKSVSINHAKNAAVVGYPSADLFLECNVMDPWKIKDRTLRRIIWAPHFTIKSRKWSSHSSFLTIADEMLEYAKANQNKVQIAFKPHPRLRTELYRHPEWGVKKTEDYYSQWSKMPNTLLETGPYYNLFKSSDALVHDSDSFMIEYQYTLKPCLFVLCESDFFENLNPLGKKAFDLHYKANNMSDIISFIEGVLVGNDFLLSLRKNFFQEYLMPPNGCTVAENIYKDLVQSLFRE